MPQGRRMSNVNRERDSESLSTVIDFAMTQFLRTHLHTAIPGIIDSYDVTTRRARVRPALRLVKTGDRPGEDGEAVERALAVNVPVAWAAGGGGAPNGLMSFIPLQAGDRGLLIFSERGLTEWKQTGELATPDKARFFDESDAMFFPFDFGHPADPTIVDSASASLQTYDGNTAFLVKQGEVKIKVGPLSITATESSVTIDTPGDTVVFQ